MTETHKDMREFFFGMCSTDERKEIASFGDGFLVFPMEDEKFGGAVLHTVPLIKPADEIRALEEEGMIESHSNSIGAFGLGKTEAAAKDVFEAKIKAITAKANLDNRNMVQALLVIHCFRFLCFSPRGSPGALHQV